MTRAKLSLESLETRRLLTVAVEVANGDLVISGEADGAVEVTALGNGDFQVSDDGVVIQDVDTDGNAVDTWSGVDDDIRIKLERDDEADNQVVILLNGETVDDIFVDVGRGNNELSIDDGTVEGRVVIRGGDGADHVQLGPDLEVSQSVFARLGSGDDSILVAGTIGRDLRTRMGDGDDSILLDSTALIGRNLQANLGGGTNELIHAGVIEGNLAIRSGMGDDTVQLIADSLVEGRTRIHLGSGDNSIEVGGTLHESIRVQGGDGADDVSITESATVVGDVAARLGGGENSLLHSGTITGSLRATSSNEDDVMEVSENGVVEGETNLTPGEQTENSFRRSLRRGIGLRPSGPARGRFRL